MQPQPATLASLCTTLVFGFPFRGTNLFLGLSRCHQPLLVVWRCMVISVGLLYHVAGALLNHGSHKMHCYCLLLLVVVNLLPLLATCYITQQYCKKGC